MSDDDEAALSMLWAYAAGATFDAPEKVRHSLGELGSAALTQHRKITSLNKELAETVKMLTEDLREARQELRDIRLDPIWDNRQP